jgi:nitrogen fixation protein FixH
MSHDGHHDPAGGDAVGRRAWLWPLGVVGMLCVSLSVCAITVLAAVNDPSYAIEDDYYQKAMDWDRERAFRIVSDRLGWRATIAITNIGQVAVVLTDAEGRPIDNASVRATAFHHARRGLAEELTLQARGEGRYVATLSHPREGQWQVRLRASLGRDRFLHTEDLFTRNGTP